MRYRPVLAAAVPVLFALAAPAAAAPTCTTVPQPVCGGRVVAEPEQSVTFHQFDGPLESAGGSLEAIEALAPDFLEVMTLAEATGDPKHTSFGGRPIWVVRVTDEKAPRAGKAQVAASLSVHGLESAGREGGFRYLEDLARWSVDEPDRLLYAGDTGIPFAEVMRRTETWIGFTNSDGWAAGDVDTDASNGPGFQRGNDNGGKDLNRDFATVGWFDRTGGRGIAESEPEIDGWTDLVESFPNLKTSTDIHGELTTPNNAFSDLIIPAGQWTPKRQDQVNQLSLNMIRTVERKFEEEGVVLDDVFGPLPEDGATPRRAANVAASYDIVGYDDSGFMGDWFSQTQDSVHMDVENFLSNLAPNNAYVPLVEQAHVAAVRGNLEATIVEALLTDRVQPRADYGRIAYVADPLRTSSDPAVKDGDPGTGADVVEGELQTPYDVSRLDYYPVLKQAFGGTIDPVTAGAVAAGKNLRGYDTLVVTDMEVPYGGPAVDKAKYVAALDAFAKAGGQLVLTDRALGLLDDLKVVAADALTVNRTDAGHVDFVAPLGDHPYEKGLVGAPSQTYYEVMLGYPSRVQAPNYGVERTAWEAAGGTTVATVGEQGGDSPNTALGHLTRGKGRLTVFGAILPQAVESLPDVETPHPHGLASYAVTITGGQVLDNVFAYRGAARTGAAPVAGPGAPRPTGDRLPTTGLLDLVAIGGFALLGATAVVRRRARR
ncbi:MAG: hypothetical protein JWM62_434 [Frankiales bacterium]|nr:hypothetical protein [Frankiales bacterium]